MMHSSSQNRVVARMERLATKANTKFPAWWSKFNAELVKRGLPEAGFDDASGCYEMGESPETAASNFEAMQ